MEEPAGPAITSSAAPDEGRSGRAALRDATAIARRIADDERAADEARVRYRRTPIPPIDPDETIGPLVAPDERVLARRTSIVFDRRHPTPPGAPGGVGLGGELYLTSQRLVLVGRVTLSLPLAEIDEVVLSGERVLLVMHAGAGIALDVDRPRLLRVEIAAARAAARG